MLLFFHRDVETPVNPVAAASAFKKHCGDLMIAITEPLPLAYQLYSRDVISEEVKDKMLLPITKGEKNMALLDAIEARIRTKPSDFWTLVTVLGTDIVLCTFATRLRETYCK